MNPINLNTPELQVKVDRQRAADMGVRMTDISDAVRLFYSGEDEITRFKEGSEQYPVTMQLLPEQRDNPEVLNRMMVPSSRLGQVRLKNVASIGRGFGPATLGATIANSRSASLPTSPPATPSTWAPRIPCRQSRISVFLPDTPIASPAK